MNLYTVCYSTEKGSTWDMQVVAENEDKAVQSIKVLDPSALIASIELVGGLDDPFVEVTKE